jgi:hypothetical protein
MRFLKMTARQHGIGRATLPPALERACNCLLIAVLAFPSWTAGPESVPSDGAGIHRRASAVANTEPSLAAPFPDGVSPSFELPAPRIGNQAELDPTFPAAQDVLNSSVLLFTESVGQFEANARFAVHGDDQTTQLTEDGIWV